MTVFPFVFIQFGAYVTDTKWDWPEWMCIDYTPEGYRLKSLPTGKTSMEKVGLLSGHGKITGPINRTIYSNDLHSEGRGCTTAEKLMNKRDETYCRSADVPTSFTKNYALPQSSGINLGLARNHNVDAANLNHFSKPSRSPYFTASTGGNYNGNHFHADLLEKNFDASFCNPAPRSAGVLSYDSRAHRPTIPNKILQDSLGSASNTELKLGQSSYHQSLTSLFPSVQSTAIDFRKPQSHLPLISQSEFVSFYALPLSFFCQLSFKVELTCNRASVLLCMLSHAKIVWVVLKCVNNRHAKKLILMNNKSNLLWIRTP
jgi:hypothetical protein